MRSFLRRPFLEMVALTIAGFFAAGGFQARAVDCRFMKTAIEETICADKTLTEKEGELTYVYQDILRRADQQQHDQLIEEQLRWSKERDATCANRLSPERKACIADMASSRKHVLAAKSLPQAPAQAGPTTKPYEGHWESCQRWQGNDICSYYTLFQKGDRICGSWQYYATGFYNGNLIWGMNGKAADWRYICGRAGSETSSWCNGDDAPLDHTGWEETFGSLYICSGPTGRYLQPLEESCAAKPKYNSRHWRALDAKQRELPKTTKWLAECLEDMGFPDKSTIVAPKPR